MIDNRFNRWSRQGVWQDVFNVLSGSSGVIGAASMDSTLIKAYRSAAGVKGAFDNAIGRTTKVHTLSDERGRPRAFTLTPSQVHDLTTVRRLC